MCVRKGFLGYFIGMFLLVSCIGSFASQVSLVPEEEPLASLSTGSRGIYFKPKVSYSAMVLAVSKPDGSQFQQTFEGGTPIFQLSGDDMDGTYTYELKFIPRMERKSRKEIEEKRKSSFSLDKGEEGKRIPYPKSMVQTGYFQVLGGRIVTGGEIESNDTSPDTFSTQDVLHYDDVIITGSLAVGFDSVNGESFGYDTVRLKENNLRLHFMDTSVGTFPTNDWRIIINDTTSGGASYFSISDVTGGKRPFTIEAGAPGNSLYIEDYGRIGIGTSIPYVELHIVDGDSPTVRLDQDGSSGWTAQRWDLCGNETNFFIRDVTNGSKLCFRIQPNTPSNTLCMRSTGRVGIGTWSPDYKFEVETTGENSAVVVQRTDGATNYINATASHGNFGTVSNHPVRIAVNSVWRARFDNDNSVTMANGATCTAGGSWVDSSSREVKENISSLSAEEAMDTLDDLEPVKFNYKVDEQEKHVGFIAEDVPELVATKNRKGMSPMDVVAVLTKVVQEQQRTISEHRKMAEEQKKLVQEQQEIIAQFQERISELERRDKKNN